MAMTKIRGRCMACGADDTLFVADGGYVTCSRSDCSDPGAVSDLLTRPAIHVLVGTENGWGLQHPVTCFPDLTECKVHERLMIVSEYMEFPPGKWSITAERPMVLSEWDR